MSHIKIIFGFQSETQQKRGVFVTTKSRGAVCYPPKPQPLNLASSPWPRLRHSIVSSFLIPRRPAAQ